MKTISKKGFSLVELIIVIVIIAILSGAAYIGIQKAKSKSMNDKVLDDLIAITNSLEQYKRDHLGEYPMPLPGGSMNMNCFYADASYAHDCSNAAFVQGMIDNDLLTKRYLQEVPTDPRMDSRYVYGVSLDKKYFQVAGLYEQSDGTWIAKTMDNLGKGYHLPSLIRAYNGPNFVVNEGTNLPYSPDHMTLTATLENVNGTVTVEGDGKTNGDVVYPGDTIITGGTSSVDLFFSDGSVSHLSENGELEILTDSEVEENDSDNIITKIKIKLFSGKIWNKVARLASKSEFNVQTTSAIAGVRGTEFGVDGDEEDILVYSGTVCLLNDLTDTALVDDIKDCMSMQMEEVAIIDDPIIVQMIHANYDETTNTGLDDLMDEQTMRYLNENIQPRILQISGDEITVQNINDFYGIPVGEYITVNKLSAYTEPYTEGESPITDIDIDTLIAGDYVLDLDSSLPSDPVILRFEDTANNLVSGFTMPITVTVTTELTEDDLYVVVEEEEEEEVLGDCQIILDYPIGTFYTAPTTLNWHTIPTECVIDNFMVTVDGVIEGTTSETPWSLTTPIIDYGNYIWEIADGYGIVSPATAMFTYSDTTAECTTGDEQMQPCEENITTGVYAYGVQTLTCIGETWSPTDFGSAECVFTSCSTGHELEIDTCVPCPPVDLPDYAHYVSECDWGCDAGYKGIPIGDPTECVTDCGDGYIVGGEECDDELPGWDEGWCDITGCVCVTGYDPIAGGGCELAYTPLHEFAYASQAYYISNEGINNEDWNYAVTICNALNEGGYTDWYLPEKDFLVGTYGEWGDKLPGGATRFWSNTEYDLSNVYIVKNDGMENLKDKTLPSTAVGFRCLRLVP